MLVPVPISHTVISGYVVSVRFTVVLPIWFAVNVPFDVLFWFIVNVQSHITGMFGLLIRSL